MGFPANFFMIQREISELKKRFKKDDCSVNRIAGCYVSTNENNEKYKKGIFNFNFLNQEEEVQFKYMEIFKKAMSGKIGKSINTLDFTLQSEEKGKSHEFLLKLRDSELKHDELLDIFYEKVMEKYVGLDNYLILLMYDAYDVISKAKDNTSLDESEEVFSYISVYICPVEMEDPGLVFDESTQKFIQKDRRRIINMPTYSFMFPAFEDRTTDIHKVMIYTKKTDGSMDDFTHDFFDIEPVLAADIQKETFLTLIQNLSDSGKGNFKSVIDINSAISKKIENEGGTSELEATDIKKIITENGISEDEANLYIKEYEESIKAHPVMAGNLINNKHTEIKVSKVLLKVDNDVVSKIETRMIDNEKYLLVPMDTGDDIRINGIAVN